MRKGAKRYSPHALMKMGPELAKQMSPILSTQMLNEMPAVTATATLAMATPSLFKKLMVRSMVMTKLRLPLPGQLC